HIQPPLPYHISTPPPPPPHTYTLSLHDALPILAKYHETPGEIAAAIEHGNSTLSRAIFRGFRESVEAQYGPDIRKSCYKGHIDRSEEHTSELRSRVELVCSLLLEKKKSNTIHKE